MALRSGTNADIAHYLQKNNLNWQVIKLMNDGALAQAFGVNAVPAVFIVGPDGTIGFITLGYVTEVRIKA